MTPELKLQKALYEYWDWFQAQYTDDDDLPDWVYRAPDGELYVREEIRDQFLDDLNEKIYQFIVKELPIGKDELPEVNIEVNRLPF